MLRTRKLLTTAAVLAAATLSVLAPDTASARKKGVLEGEPVVRKKLQLRRLRLQVTPEIAMSLSQPFVHMGYVGANLGFHFTEWLGLKAGFMWGVVKVDSQLLKDLNDRGLPEAIAPGQADPTTPSNPVCPANGPPCRPVAEEDNPAPLKHDFQAGLTRAEWQSSIDVVFTPFVGKLGLFSAIFTEYDIYLFGGLGLMGWVKHYENARSTAELGNLPQDPGTQLYCRPTMTSPQNQDCVLHPVTADNGVHLGFSFGGGVNLFITDWVSLNLEIQDIITRNNLTGLNATIEDIPPRVDNSDKDIFHNVTLHFGAKFYIPFRAKRTR